VKPAKSASDSGQKPDGQCTKADQQDSESTYELSSSKVQEIGEKRRLEDDSRTTDDNEKSRVHCHCDEQEEEAEMVGSHAYL
jgi:hypothetical protein